MGIISFEALNLNAEGFLSCYFPRRAQEPRRPVSADGQIYNFAHTGQNVTV